MKPNANIEHRECFEILVHSFQTVKLNLGTETYICVVYGL